MGSWQGIQKAHKFLAYTCLILICSSAVSQTNDAAKTWTPNFKDADILEVINFVQQATGQSMVIDPRVKGTITVMTAQPVNEEKLYDLFLASLSVHGFTAVEVNGIVRVLPDREVRSSALPFQQSSSEADRYVTAVISLNNVAANQVIASIRPLVGQNAQLAPYQGSNVLIMVDTAANVARIRELVEQLDKAATPETEVIRLDYANAEELVRTLTQLERSEAANNQAAATKLQIVADKRSNAVLVTGEGRQRARVKELIQELDRPQLQNGGSRIVYLEFADAANIAQLLNSVAQNEAKQNPDAAAAPGGARGDTTAAIVADPDTNALIITSDVESANNLVALAKGLDVQRAQVLVEAIIVEISDEVGKNLGVQWLFRNDDGGFAGNFKPNDPANAVLGDIVGGALDDDREQGLTDLAGALVQLGGQSIGVGRLKDGADLLALIDMLYVTSGANILSTPNIITTDNNTATISVGEAVPFVTGSFTNTGTGGSGAQNPFQTIDRNNVGTTLEVTPHVNGGNKVALDIVQEVSSISPKTGAADLITNERRIETSVIAGNGETIILGGLIRDNVIQRETRVPLLGSIPVLGHLFRSQSTSVQKTNLLVFIRPTIIRNDEEMRGATAEKYNYIRDRQIDQRGVAPLLTNDNNLPLLPDWDSVQEQLQALQKQQAENQRLLELENSDTQNDTGAVQ